jgi:hypothetical protein
MPLHDWTRVPAGIYHHFHNAWITAISDALNDGLLPDAYYALGEQRSGDIGPDVLTLRTAAEDTIDEDFARVGGNGPGGAVAVAEAPPRVSIMQDAAEDMAFYLARQRTVVIRHVSGDRIIALLEIVSPANKRIHKNLDKFVDKLVAALQDGVHVLIVDPLPPRRYDPEGIHGAVWERLAAGSYQPPTDLPLTLVSYAVRHPITAYVEPIRVGSLLIDMPLFLTSEYYVPIPLEATYERAWSGVPRRWRGVIEGEA